MTRNVDSGLRMKKVWVIISVSLCIAMLFFMVNQGNPAFAIESSIPDTQPPLQESTSITPVVPGVNESSEKPTDNNKSGQSSQNLSLTEQQGNRTLAENPQERSTVRAPRAIQANNDNIIESIILNTLPEVKTPSEPDTLGQIIHWWSKNPLPIKIWYLYLILTIVMFLFGQKSFRKPLLFLGLVTFGFYLKNVVNPINSIFYLLVQTGTQLVDSIILVAIPIFLSLFLGRFFCGWACPIGAIQEFIHPENLELRLPALLDRIFSYFRFLLLAGGLLFSWSAMSNVWNSYDPFQSLFTFNWSLMTNIILAIVLLGSILIDRFFCRYLCPLGGVLAVISKFSLLKMRPDSNTCIACGKCSQPGICPMNMISAANPYTDLPGIEASECIVCYRCENNCRYSAIKFSIATKSKAKTTIKTQNNSEDLSA